MTPLHVLPSLTGPVGARPQRASQSEDKGHFPTLLGQVATGDRDAARPDEPTAQTTKDRGKDGPSDISGSAAALDAPNAAGSASLMVLLAPLLEAQPDRSTAGPPTGTAQLQKLAIDPNPGQPGGAGTTEHSPVPGGPAVVPALQGREVADGARVSDLPADPRPPATGPASLPPEPAVVASAGIAQVTTSVSPPIQQSPAPVRPAAGRQAGDVAPTSPPARKGISADPTESRRNGASFKPDAAETNQTGSTKLKPVDAAATEGSLGQPESGPAPSAAEQVVTALQQIGLEATPTAPREASAPGGSPPASGTVQDNTTAVSAQARSLTIELNPENLGPVSVTLRKTATGVDIQIAVSTPEALHALERDRHVLTAAVAAAGGSHDRLALTNLASVHADAATPTTIPASGQDPPSPGAAPPGASAGGGQPRDQQRSDPSRAAQTTRDDQASTPPPLRSDRLDGSLYL